MSLRILFADDSVTAQNMGKKILTDAGYEVVAVSNGAAAVKKIAEQKPDIIILDVYMPGYSGLEVCEKVRSSIATIKTPVLLTVGKMEPYKPEEANRVRADGVIIKPFEASDLLAIIKKFEERIGTASAHVAEAAKPAVVAAEPVEEIAVQPAERNEASPRISKAVVEVPDHMATSSAFSDLLGTDATRMDQFPVPAVAQPAPSAQPEASIEAPHYQTVVSRSEEPDQPKAAEAAAVSAPVAAEPDTVKIPVYEEPEPSHYEIVPTATAPIGDIEIPREAALQETAEQTTRETVADLREPDLVPTAHQMPEAQHIHAVQATPRVAEMPIAPAEHVPEVEAAHQQPERVAAEIDHGKNVPPAAPSLSEADFEARVAAAMAAYGRMEHSEPVSAVTSEPPAAPVPTLHDEPSPVAVEAPAIETSPIEAPVGSAARFAATAVDGTGVREIPAFENAPVALAPDTPAMPEKAEAHAAAAGAGSDHASITASVEAELAAAAQSVAQPAGLSEGEHDNIAQAVNRVMERMKENLVEEIVRELKGKK